MQLTQEEITRLSPDERLSLIAQLWDSLEDHQVQLTPAQQAEIDSVVQRMADNPRRDHESSGRTASSRNNAASCILPICFSATEIMASYKRSVCDGIAIPFPCKNIKAAAIPVRLFPSRNA
jgi:putative addiction module component (TIGR02574 family)